MTKPPYSLKDALSPEDWDWLENVCDDPKFLRSLETTYHQAWRTVFAHPDYPTRAELKRLAQRLLALSSELREILANRHGHALFSLAFGEEGCSKVAKILGEPIVDLDEIANLLKGSGGHANDAAHVIAYYVAQDFKDAEIEPKSAPQDEYVRVVQLLFDTLGITGNARHYASQALRYLKAERAPGEIFGALLKELAPSFNILLSNDRRSSK